MSITAAGWYPDPQNPSQQRYWNGSEWTGDRAQAARGSMVMSDKKGKPAQLLIAWTAAVLTLGYMLPWAIAATRGKANSGAIGLLNLLLGWTVVGWVVALVMACGAHQKFAA